MKTKQTSLTKGAMFQTAGKLFLEGVAFFTAPIFTRILSTTDYGKMSIYSTWCSLLTIFVGLQVGGAIANAKIEYKEEEIPGFMSSIMTLALCSFSFFAVLTVVFCKPLSEFINIRLDLVFLLLIQSFSSFCIGFYNGKLVQFKRADKSMYLSVTVSLLSTALSLVLVFSLQGEKYIAKIYGAAIPTIIIGLFLCVYVLVKGKVFFRTDYWKFCLPLTLPLILHGAGHLILGQSDRVMIQKMIGESETGIYSISVTVTSIMVMIYGSFNEAWVPYYYEFKKKNDNTSILEKSKHYILNISLFFAGFLLVVPEVFKLLVPITYWDLGLKLIPILTLAYFFRYLYLFPVNHEFYNRNTKLVAVGTFTTASLNILLNYFFIKKISVLGAAIATCFSDAVLFLFHLIIAKFVIKDYEYTWKFYILGMVVVIPALLIYYGISQFWIVRWGMAVCVGILLLCHLYKRKSLF